MKDPTTSPIKEFLEVESEKEHNEEKGNKKGSLKNEIGIKWDFCGATWKN